ncbi:MAG TPA: tetratricopeptide repeat protein [Rhodocyclaceae bacterium]|nr:tetratricopeptide repeat protein [Rhodocyclaceae bacterium]
MSSLDAAYALVGQGRFAQAEDGLKELLRAEPANHGAIHLLALLACQVRRFDVAEALATEAARLAPATADYLVTLGRARKGLSRLPEAETALRQALALDAGNADALVLLGLVLKAQGDLEGAAAAYGAALEVRPDFPEAKVNLGNVLRELGAAGRAASLYEQAAQAAPDLAAAQNALVASLIGEGREADALAHLRRTLRSDPGLPHHQFLRGLLSQKQGGPAAEAIEAYGRVLEQFPDHADAWTNLGLALTSAGRPEEGMRCHQRALQVDRDHVPALVNSGLAHSAFGANGKAISSLKRAVALRPYDPQALSNLGGVLILDGRLAEAEDVLRRALAVDPASSLTRANLGAALRYPGRLHESIEVLRGVLADDPGRASAQDNLLLSMLYADGISAAEIAEAARACAASSPSAGAPVAIVPTGARRLRVGYLSPDLRRHSVAYFLEPALAHHDKERFEVFCYHLSALEDDVSARFKGYADHWRNVYGLPAATVAQRIRDDGIDILVDLAGRTGQNCLAAVAERPAPVQLTWLGYPSTVGVAALDYRITDWQVDPAGYECNNVETPLRLPHSYFCYRPGAAPPIGAMPSLAGGHITFGSFNNLAKLSDSAIALWAGVLRAVPDASLLLKNKMLAEESLRTRTRDAFAALGVSPARLELLAWMPSQDNHLDLYNRIDIALDTYPYNGATTTCEALWMGVPVVSRCGETHAARMGRSILCAAGLPELVAQSDEDFVTLAAQLASDATRRETLRGTLRGRLFASPLMDEAGFTRALEQCYLEAAYHRG